MKGKYWLTETGRIVAKPCNQNTAKERRKLKLFKRYLETGEMDLQQITCSYNSYRGHILKNYDCHTTVRNMDRLFHDLFGYDSKINRKESF